jgi:hypothetical protein
MCWFTNKKLLLFEYFQEYKYDILITLKKLKGLLYKHSPYLLTLPLFAGVSRVRALSPAWTGSHARETLISRTHLSLPHDLPQNVY